MRREDAACCVFAVRSTAGERFDSGSVDVVTRGVDATALIAVISSRWESSAVSSAVVGLREFLESLREGLMVDILLENGGATTSAAS